MGHDPGNLCNQQPAFSPKKAVETGPIMDFGMDQVTNRRWECPFGGMGPCHDGSMGRISGIFTCEFATKINHSWIGKYTSRRTPFEEV